MDSTYHSPLRFVTGSRALLALATCRLFHWDTFIYKAIFGLFPTYLCVFIKRKSTRQYSLHSLDSIMLSIPNARAEIGKRAFGFAHVWNLPQDAVKVQEFVSLSEFQCELKMSLFYRLNKWANSCICMCAICFAADCIGPVTQEKETVNHNGDKPG